MSTSPLSAEAPEDLIAQITTAVAGLFWVSETDAPFEVLHWSDIAQDRLTAAEVLCRAQLPDETPVEVITLDDLLAPVTQSQPWHTQEDIDVVEQFQSLQTLLENVLTQIQVYRCGTVELDIYVVGHTQALGWLALRTTAVET
jgi:hypothetical protein